MRGTFLSPAAILFLPPSSKFSLAFFSCSRRSSQPIEGHLSQTKVISANRIIFIKMSANGAANGAAAGEPAASTSAAEAVAEASALIEAAMAAPETVFTQEEREAARTTAFDVWRWNEDEVTINKISLKFCIAIVL